MNNLAFVQMKIQIKLRTYIHVMFASRRGIFTIATSGDGNPPMAQHFRSFFGNWETDSETSPAVTKQTLTRTQKPTFPPNQKGGGRAFHVLFSGGDGHGGWMFGGVQSKPNDNDGLEKGTPFKHGNLLVSMLDFWGVYLYMVPGRQPCQFFKNL